MIFTYLMFLLFLNESSFKRNNTGQTLYNLKINKKKVYE